MRLVENSLAPFAWPELYPSMEADSSSLPPEGLLSDLEWLGKLARRLVSDPDLADDACQEAWLLASRKAEDPRFDLDRRSLLLFLRSYVWRTRRSDQRRTAREASVARPDRLPSTEELLLIGERQQELWRHLSGLPEPYRSTLLLHYQQGITTADLAKRKGLAVDTVRWRLRRGLQLLRASLERAREGPQLMGLIPMAVASLHRWEPTVAAGSLGTVGRIIARLGTLLMTKKLSLAIGTTVLLIMGWNLLRGPGLETPVPSRETDGEMVELASSPPLRGESILEPSAPEDVGRLPVVSAVPREASTSAGWSLGLTVLGPGGQGAGGASVMMAIGKTTETLGVTDGGGRLICPLLSLDARGLALWDTAFKARLVVSHDRFASGEYRMPIEAFGKPGVCDVTVTLSSDSCLRGRVHDPSGNPLEGASCTLWESRAGRRPSHIRSTLSNAKGSFALPVEPGTRGFVMVETASGRTCTEAFDIGTATDLGTLYLDELANLSGRVIHPDGQPVSDVQVFFRVSKLSPEAPLREDGSFVSGHTWGSTSTDVQGRFEFLGVRPGAYVVSARTGSEQGGGKLEVELPCSDVTLTTPNPRLRVHVSDVNGVPASGLRVHMRILEPRGDTQGWFRATNELGVFSTDITNGSAYALVALSRYGSPVERVVRIPPTGFQHEAHIVIGESSRSCNLRVALEGPEGQEMQDFSVLLRTLPTLLSLEEEERSPEADGLLSNLPEGRFSLKIYSEVDPGERHYLYLEEDEQVVELSPDLTPEISFRMTRGGHIEALLDVGGWPPNTPTCPPASDGAGKAAWLRRYGVVIYLSERFEDGGSRGGELSRRLGTFDEHHPWTSSEFWTPGTTTRNWEVLKPGLYAYHVSGTAWHPMDGLLEVRAGESTRMNLALNPR